MGKATARKRLRQPDTAPVWVQLLSHYGPRSRLRMCSRSERPRSSWQTLPLAIVHIIMEMLGSDREALSACSVATRGFTFAALSCLGRHITVDTVRRLRECADLVSKGSAFQHVRSLDLDVATKRIIHEGGLGRVPDRPRGLRQSSHLDSSLVLGSTLLLHQPQETGDCQKDYRSLGCYDQRTGVVSVSFLVLHRDDLPDSSLPTLHLTRRP